MSGGHQYHSANISGEATAIFGDRHGDTIHIQQATFLLQATSTAQTNNGTSRSVRHNQVLAGGQTTVETIKIYHGGEHIQQRGAIEENQLRWERCEDIGVGSFGEVHREQVTSEGQLKSRAVKVLRRRHLKHMGIDHKKELDALIDLSQPHFVHRFIEFYSWYESHDYIYLAMEYIPCGDLESCIEAGLTESDVRQIAYQVLDGMRIMHDLDLAHRDIKPGNVFVVQKEPIWWVKLGDFSICKRSTTRQTVLRTQVGTQGYQAPEVLGLIDTGKTEIYDSQCDIWSYGCLVFEMLTKQLPFPDIRALMGYCNQNEPFPGHLMQNSGGTLLLAEFALALLQANPAARPTADQAILLLSYRCESILPSEAVPGSGKYLYLQDCMSRCFKLPFHYCARWVDMDSTLKMLLSYIQLANVAQNVSRGFYSLRTLQGMYLDSSNWEQAILPGMFLTMWVSPAKCMDTSPRNDNLDSLESPTTPPSAVDQSPAQSPASGQASGEPVQEPRQFDDHLAANASQDRKQGTKLHETDSSKEVDDEESKSQARRASAGVKAPVHPSSPRSRSSPSVPTERESKLFGEASSRYHPQQLGHSRTLDDDIGQAGPSVTDHEKTRPEISMKASIKNQKSQKVDPGLSSNKWDEPEDETITNPIYLVRKKKPERMDRSESGDHAPRADWKHPAGPTANDPLAERTRGLKDVHVRQHNQGADGSSPARPTYIRVRKEHVLPETLDAFLLPWNVDSRNEDYVMITQDVSTELLQQLFEHTRNLKLERLERPERPEWQISKDDYLRKLQNATVDARSRSTTDKSQSRPTYIRVHRKHLLPETLNTHNLPWEIDRNDNEYIIIKQYISADLQEELFTHTRKIQESRSLVIEKSPESRKKNSERKKSGHLFFVRKK